MTTTQRQLQPDLGIAVVGQASCRFDQIGMIRIFGQSQRNLSHTRVLIPERLDQQRRLQRTKSSERPQRLHPGLRSWAAVIQLDQRLCGGRVASPNQHLLNFVALPIIG